MAFNPGNPAEDLAWGEVTTNAAYEALAVLRNAAATGVLTVQARDGRRVTYRTMAELMRAIEYFEGLIKPSTPRAGVTLATFERN